MKTILTILIVSLAVVSADAAQKQQKPRPRTPVRSSATPKPPAARMVGSTIVITTKNGDRIKAELLDLSAYSVRIRADNLESVLALDTIAAISFGSSAGTASRNEQAATPPHPKFPQDAAAVLGSLQSMATQTKSGIDYTEYGRFLSDLRRDAERFIQEYSTSENTAEAKTVALVAGALADYTWARTTWTLKINRTGDGLVGETDSPAVSDALALYPDLRAMAASGNRFSADKLISGLWRKASEKTDRARAVAGQPR